MKPIWALVSVVAVVGLFCAGGWGLESQNRLPGGLNPMWWAAAGSLVAGILGMVPLLLVVYSGKATYLPQAVMGGMALRVLISAGYFLAVQLADAVPFAEFAAWMLLFYFALWNYAVYICNTAGILNM